MGGQNKIRALWKHYFAKTKALIFVVDSSDADRISAAAKELRTVLGDPQMKEVVVLVLANKRDVSAISLDSFRQQMELDKMDRVWGLYSTTAIKKEHSGLQEAFQWLVATM